MTYCFYLVCALMPVGSTSGECGERDMQLRQLVGTWEVQTCAVQGVDYPGEVGKCITINAQGKILRADGDEDIALSFKLNPDKRPRQIDFLRASKKQNSVLIVKGIYRLKGNFLEICAGTPEDERPKTISKKGTGYQLLKRVDSQEK